MNAMDQMVNGSNPSSPTRRRLLASVVSAYTASLVPWAMAQPVADGEHGAFIALSALLAGRPSLDIALADRLYKALSSDDPGFPDAAHTLLTFIEQQKIDPLALQKTLDDAKSPLAPLPRKIVTAWYMGIVGSGENAQVFAYEHALNALAVSDVLKPPTYAYGVYGSWARKPT